PRHLDLRADPPRRAARGRHPHLLAGNWGDQRSAGDPDAPGRLREAGAHELAARHGAARLPLQ
ncbi:unnamed protein product, partial [Effrenium voratum]